MLFELAMLEMRRKGKEFYVNAQFFNIRYGQLAKTPGKLQHDFKNEKDKKIPAFPAAYEIGGTCCICMTKKPGDKAQHDKAMHDYFYNVFQTLPYSPSTADLFRCGDDWEIQQIAAQSFYQAVQQTISDYDIVWTPTVPPFDEMEAVTELLKAFAIAKLLQKVLDPVERSDLPPAIKNRTLDGARSSLATAIDSASKGWAPLAEGAKKANTAAAKVLKDGAEEIVEKLKPLIAKVVGLIKEKMKKKADEKGGDEGKELDEKKEKKNLKLVIL